MEGCDSCTLKQEWRKLRTPVMPTEHPMIASTPRVLIVGEAPDDSEDNLGKLFTNKYGRFLKDHLGEAARGYYFSNVVRCAPPANREPHPHEIACCTKGFLDQDLIDINPHVIMTIGEEALWHLIPHESLSVLRGLYLPYEFADGGTCWIYPLYDAQHVLKFGNIDVRPQEDRFNATYPVWKSDIARFHKLCKTVFHERPRKYTPPTREQIHFPKSIKEAEAVLAKMVRKPTVDIETSKKKPYMRGAKMLTCAISDGLTTMSFPVEWPNLIPWGKEFLANYFAGKYDWTAWKAHNAGFELVWFSHRFPGEVFDFEDTMAKARFLHERTRILSLDTQSLIHLGTPIKDETDLGMLAALRRNDESILQYPLDAILYYGGLDTWAQANLDEELDLPDSQLENYARSLDSIASTVAMEIAGLPINFPRSIELHRGFVDRMDALEQEANLLTCCLQFEREYGRKVSLSKPDDVAIVILKFLGKKLPESSRNKYTTDEAALSKVIADGGGRFPQLVLDHREVAKQDSTYVEPIISGAVIGTDNLMHAAYSVVLTATGRLSGVDPNIQNFPKRKNKEVREQVVPPPGCIAAAFDYGQLEARVLGMASKDKALMQSFIREEDIHSKWLDIILKYYPVYFDRLRKKTGKVDEKSLRKAGRDIIKTDFVFASFYGSKIGSVAARTDIPQNIVAEIWHQFWAEYPGVLSWQLEMFNTYVEHGGVWTLTDMFRNEVLAGNEPINTPIQGLAAHLVLEAQNALHQKSIRERDPYLLPRMNIHDDLMFFLPDDERLEGYINVIGQEIVKPRFDFVNVPLMTECRVGYDWANLEAITKIMGDYHRV